MSNPNNTSMIRQHLAGNYTFVDSEGDAGNSLADAQFDLCILDNRKFNSHSVKEILAERKDQASPVYLPVILLVREHKLKEYINSDLGIMYDDVLPMPISSPILESRIESLCKQRRNSLDLHHKNYLANRAINATDIGISIADASREDNPLIFVNTGFEDLTGYKEEEVLGRNCRFLQGEDRDQQGIRKLRNAVEEGISTKALIRNSKKDGTLFWNSVKVDPIENPEGETDYFVGIQDDVTELIETQNELRQIVEEKEVLLQEIHHRIKNNLAVIVALLELKMLNTNSEETKISLIETRTRIFSIAKVHELLYEHDQLSQIKFKVYVRGLTDHLDGVYSKISGKLDFKFDLEDVQLNLDQAVPCGMLLSELITNIYKHGFEEGESGEVEITLKEEGDYVQVSVKDNGKGLPENGKLENMDNFSQSIIHTLLKQLEAEWEARSGNGFEFTFYFKCKNYTGMISETGS